MNRKLLCATSTCALAMSAIGVANASPPATEEQMMDACIHQYVQSNLGNYQGKVTVNKMGSTNRAMGFGTKTQIKVSAVHRTSGELLGTVICDVTSTGTVTVAEPNAVAAAKLAKLNKSTVIASTSTD